VLKESYSVTFPVLEPLEEETLMSLAHEAGSQGVEIREQGLEVCFAQRAEAESFLSFLSPELRQKAGEIKIIPAENYMALWRESAQPVQLANEFWAVPPWALTNPDLQIVIDPQMAFGTGHHASTQLAAEALIKMVRNKEALEEKLQLSALNTARMYEVGAGSGILCYLGVKLGIGQVMGIEIDPGTAKNISQNHRSNGFENPHLIAIGSTNILKNKPYFHFLVINEIRTRVELFLDKSLGNLKPGGFLVWSGTLCREWPLVANFAQSRGLIVQERLIKDEWTAAIFKKKHLL